MSKLLTAIGVISLLIGLGISGTMGSGDRIRSNYTNEAEEDRKRRNKITGYALLISAISFGLKFLIFS